jgi:branched-chain amino acid transport system ATP-binding protein
MGHPMLEVSDVKIRYSRLTVVHGVSLRVEPGETVCVVGANGAGKSSLLRGIMGAQPLDQGRILLNHEAIHGLRTDEIVRRGVVYVPEGRMLFGPLSVEENLFLGAYILKDPSQIQNNLTMVYDLFPRLRERRPQPASTMSGGEQQMLAIGRGLMSNPRLFMLDEPSFGLSPLLVTELFHTFKRLKDSGVTILLVEQNVQEALEFADRGYVIQAGRVTMEGESQKLLENDLIRKAYLGM